ncbi:MAG: AAA family ATPase [Paludibacter sp.]|jgi:exonuclease SbcC|nr:AAA family ATPase [Paludibacter sp.]
MKILAIRGKNLASLENEFEIDFTCEPLVSAGIFAITGHTGAGKSTLLDALCLALFDNTPRLKNASDRVTIVDVDDKTLYQNDSRNILRRGAVEGFAEVDFLAVTGDKIRARWYLARAYKKATGTLGQANLSLENLTQQNFFYGTKKEILSEISRLVGLSFEQFTRAVLLAQGDFATFLQANSTERADLLEKLTGTEIYARISAEIYHKTKNAKIEKEFVENNLKNIALLSAEEIENFTREKSEIEQTENQQGKLLEAIKEKIKWIVDKNLLNSNLDTAKSSLKTISTEIESAKQRQEYLAQSEKAQEIRDTFRKLQENSTQLAENTKTFELNKKDLSTQTQLLQTEIENLAEIEIQFEKIENFWKSKSSEISNAQELDNKIIEAKSLLSNLEKDFSQTKQRVDLAEKSLKEKQKRLETLQKEDFTADLETLVAEQNDYNALLTTEVKTLRERLLAGVPCPVCGSTEHPMQGIFTESLEEKTLTENKKRVAEKIKLLTEKIQSQKDEIITLQAQLLSESQNVTTLQNDSTTKKQQLEKQQSALAELTTQRSKLIGGDTVENFRNRYENKKKEISDKKDKSLKNKELIVKHQSELSGKISNIEKLIAKLESEISNLESEKKSWQTAQNGIFTDDKLTEIFQKSTQWLEKERIFLQTLQDKFTSANATLAERQKNFDEHFLKSSKPENETETQEYLVENQSDTDKKLAELSSQKTEITVKLQQNTENLKLSERYANELKIKQAIYEDWAKLDALLGSATGTKFKKIVQEYSLDYLLAYANLHLQTLTQRYELQRITDTLALQVVDKDMLNELRSVHSLSGGESFLVSLALALGLSSLSSNRMKIESLFIDEGFGSLDADTLRVAIDALENLQTQGRKIGVISHVAEMTERITTQICVTKAPNGKSKVLIKG